MEDKFYTFNPSTDTFEEINILHEAPDYVNHPPHYQSKSGLEVINVIEAFTENLQGIEATDTGNIIKYACRWKEKGGVQDLKKIVWYANHLIGILESRKETEIVADNKRIPWEAD